MPQQVYHSPVYHSQSIQAWEKRWFARQNSSYGLMQQVAWTLHLQLRKIFAAQTFPIQTVAVCCGQGNNAGDGYLTAKYLQQAGFQVDIYAATRGTSTDLHQAFLEAEAAEVNIIQGFAFQQSYDCYIDALFGIGLDRPLNDEWQSLIHAMNQQAGLKIAVDIPSGLNANTGQPLPCAIKADYTFTALGLKVGLFTGQAQEYTGQVDVLDLIPLDAELKALAQLTPQQIKLPARQAFGHKGIYGHVLIVGGHAQMGGAVMMAAEAASNAGAGKVTVVCHAKHHVAILSRAPNLMLRDIDALSKVEIQQLISQVDAVSLGMGLGRDAWAEQHYTNWFTALNQSDVEVVYDADALWFLAQHAQASNSPAQLKLNSYATPHSGEAATLLGTTVAQIEADRIAAIQQLQQRYAGDWVLKGSGSLTLQAASTEPQASSLWICTAGNPGMGTGGMGDVLAGMIASLKAQFHHKIQLHEIVMLHALAGDVLAQQGMRGLQAQHMSQAIYQVVNR